MANMLEILRSRQRDLNCMKDESKITRLKGVKSFRQWIITEDIDQDILKSIMTSSLLEHFVARFSDPAESCREGVIGFLTDVSKMVEQPEDFLPNIISGVYERFGPNMSEPASSSEPSEEIRLQFISLIELLLRSAVESTENHHESTKNHSTEPNSKWSALFENCSSELSSVLRKCAGDSFPEVKKVSASCVSLLCNLCRSDGTLRSLFKPLFEDLCKALNENLSHQHSKVRQITLEAIGSLLRCNAILGKWSLTTLDAMERCQNDRTVAVKLTFAREIHSCLVNINPESEEQRCRLVYLLLGGVCDSSEEVRNLSSELFESAASTLMKSQEGRDESNTDGDAGEPPRSSTPARDLLRSVLGCLIPVIVKNLGNWTCASRSQAAGILRATVLYSQGDLEEHLASILPVCYDVVSDEEADVCERMSDCIISIGRYVVPQSYLSLIWEKLNDKRIVSFTKKRDCLKVLQRLILGCEDSPHRILPAAEEIAEKLSHPSVCFHEQDSVRRACLGVLRALLSASVHLESAAEEKVFWALLQLDSGSQDDVFTEEIIRTFEQLAGCADLSGIGEIFSKHFEFAKSAIDELAGRHADTQAKLETREGEPQPAVLDFGSPRYFLFATLLQRGSAAVPGHLGSIVPELVRCTAESVDPMARFRLMSILKAHIASAQLNPRAIGQWAPFMDTLLRTVLAPNCVWRVGKVSHMLRIETLGCIAAVLKNGMASTTHLTAALPELIPVLKSNLEGYVSDVRENSCEIIRVLLEQMKDSHTFDDDELFSLQREVVQRLDDSHDPIRILACGTLTALVGCLGSGPTAENTFREIVENALIHLDDPKEEIQESVREMLAGIAWYNGTLVREMVQSARERHTCKSICDRLLQILNE
eukprot:895965_1